MKKYIKTASSRPQTFQKRYSTKNVKEVCNAMGWEYPTSVNKTEDGYKCQWYGQSFLDRRMSDNMYKILCDQYGLNLDSLGYEDRFAKFVRLVTGKSEFYLQYRDSTDEEKEIFWQLCDERRDLYHDSELWKQSREECEEMLDEAYERTGINCFLNKGGNLIVPFAE